MPQRYLDRERFVNRLQRDDKFIPNSSRSINVPVMKKIPYTIEKTTDEVDWSEVHG